MQKVLFVFRFRRWPLSLSAVWFVFEMKETRKWHVNDFSINAVERESSKTELPLKGNMVGPLRFKPFEIKTIYLELNLADDMANGSSCKKAKLNDE